jgi:hypothetical protein
VWRQRLKKFEEQCGLVSFLGSSMGEQRSGSLPIDFDAKFKTFFSLESHNNRPFSAS